MRKKVMCLTIGESIIDYIGRMANLTGLSKSSTVEMLANIIDTYFSEEDIIREAKYNAPKDGRKKGGDEK